MLALRPPSGLAIVGNPVQEPVILPPPPPKPVRTRIFFEKHPLLQAIATLESVEEVHRRLIARPSLLEATDGYGRTPLIVACMFGDRQVVRLLLDLGANTKARSYDGRTPLIHAARRGDAAIAQDLLQSGADKAATDGADLDAFFSAMVCGHAIPFLRPEGDINVPRSSHVLFADIFAQVASLRGFDSALTLATMFVGLGGNIQLPGRHVCPPLGYAVERADVMAIRVLLQLGGCINCCDHRSQLNAAKSPPVLAALNAAWDAFLDQLKGVAPDTYLRTLPPDMLRYVILYVRPQAPPQDETLLLEL